MGRPELFHCADWGTEISDVEDSQGHPIFKKVTITWSRPRTWKHDEPAPIETEDKSSCLYCLLRDHKRQKAKDKIVYIGLTKNIHGRFYNHPKAEKIRNKRGSTLLTVGSVNFGRYWRSVANTGPALEQLEHLLIWSIFPKFNDRKMGQLPGMGKHKTKPWWIVRKGFTFHGTMPREIVYPWMLVKLGRDRSTR